MTTITLPAFDTGRPSGGTGFASTARHTRKQMANLADAATVQLLGQHRLAAIGAMQDATQAMMAMRAAAAQATTITPDWVQGQPAYALMSASVNARYATFGQAAQQLVYHYGLSGITVGVNAGTLYLSYLGKFTIKSPITSTGVQQLVDQLSDWLDDNDTLAAIQSQAATGFVNMLVGGLRNWVAGKSDAGDVKAAQDVVIDGPRGRLATVAQTTVAQNARGGMFATYSDAGATHWQWHCNLSANTCLACLGMDGQVFEMDNGFQLMHPNCLCQGLPCGPDGLPQLETGADWFARQDDAVQRAMLPGATYDAYQNGDLALSDFVGLSHDPQYGNTVYQRSGKMALEASKR